MIKIVTAVLKERHAQLEAAAAKWCRGDPDLACGLALGIYLDGRTVLRVKNCLL